MSSSHAAGTCNWAPTRGGTGALGNSSALRRPRFVNRNTMSLTIMVNIGVARDDIDGVLVPIRERQSAFCVELELGTVESEPAIIAVYLDGRIRIRIVNRHEDTGDGHQQDEDERETATRLAACRAVPADEPLTEGPSTPPKEPLCLPPFQIIDTRNETGARARC